MQFEKTNQLRKSTNEDEKKMCIHSYEKEYYLGISTGDYVCSKCGHTILDSEYFSRENLQNKS